MKPQCTTGDYRLIKRWEHEEVLEKMQRRLERNRDASRLRRQTAEHPFDTFKAWMRRTQFLTKTLPRVSTEMSLHVLAYNFKRLIRILGTGPVIEAVRI
jgi:Transposase DDE domain